MSVVPGGLAGLVLVDPWMLLLGGLVLLAAWGARRRRAPALLHAPAGALLDPDAPAFGASLRVRLRFLPRMLQLLGLLLVVVALARPARLIPVPSRSEGIDVLLCLDVSSSMAAEDLAPPRSRLDVARAAALRFAERRPGDRMGVIAFARYPELLCPLTLDHEALARRLDALALADPDGPEDATGIGAAVALGVRVLRERGAASRVVVVLTDGEENVATVQSPEEIAPVHAGQLAREYGVKVHSVAVGRGRTGPEGRLLPLDTGAIERLAAKTGGRFFSAPDARTLDAVYDEIDALETTPFEAPRFEIEDRFLAVLLAALAALVLARLLDATVFGVLP